jgi:hypoxanthine phosphoribosyltransferase
MADRDDIREVLFTEQQIAAKVRELGDAITRDYAGREILLVGVLRGGAVFLSDLMRRIGVPVRVDFLRCHAYGDATQTSGAALLQDLREPVAGREVLVVEDIVDTGATLKRCLDSLRERGAASVRVAAFLDKPAGRQVEIRPDYVGFEVPDEWVVGYGLDYAQRYRNLPFVGVLKPEVYRRGESG